MGHCPLQVHVTVSRNSHRITCLSSILSEWIRKTSENCGLHIRATAESVLSAGGDYHGGGGAALCDQGRDGVVGVRGGVERRRDKTPAISQVIVRTLGFMRGRRKPETCNPHDEIFSFRKHILCFQCKILKRVNSQCRKTCVTQVKYNSLLAEEKQFAKTGNKTRSQ